jgi:carboxymethylenebutenolidase
MRHINANAERMRVDMNFVDLAGQGRSMRAAFATPREVSDAPGLLFYSDIFQLTPSTLRMVTRFASYGFAVLAPEIYYRREAPGTAWAFDDAGREKGMADAKATSVAEFDYDSRAAVEYLLKRENTRIGVVGFCLGGHLAFRAAFNPEIAAAICYYPTGLHNGALGVDADAGSLEEANRIKGRLHVVFGTEDPHVPADGRKKIQAELKKQCRQLEITEYPAEHAFMRDEGPRHDPEVSDRAFAAGIATLRHGM